MAETWNGVSAGWGWVVEGAVDGSAHFLFALFTALFAALFAFPLYQHSPQSAVPALFHALFKVLFKDPSSTLT